MGKIIRVIPFECRLVPSAETRAPKMAMHDEYSWGSNMEHSNSEPIWNPNVLELRFRMVRFLNGPFQCMANWNGPFKNWTFQNGRFSLSHFIVIHYFSLCINRPRLKRSFWMFWFRIVGTIWNQPFQNVSLFCRDEILELLGKPTAKEQSLIDKFR